MEELNEIIERFNEWNEQGRFAEVVAETNTSFWTKDDDEEDIASIFVTRGNALYGLGRFQEALESYAKAIELDTFDVHARCNYGSTLFTLGRYVDALNASDAAILTDENFAPAYVNAAHCLAALNHTGEAVYALRQAFSLEPQNIELGLTVADMASKLDDFEVALTTYLDVAKLQGAPSDIHNKIYDLFVKFKNNPEVEKEVWEKGLEMWRDQFISNPTVLRLTGDLLRG